MFERSKSTGRIEFYNPARGYGFLIEMANGSEGARRFFHITAVVSGIGRPEVGRIVLFEPGESAKGKIALNVEVVL